MNDSSCPSIVFPVPKRSHCIDGLVWCPGRFYWRIHPQMPEPELMLIRSTWPALPKEVDAAYENSDKDMVVIFSGGSPQAL